MRRTIETFDRSRSSQMQVPCNFEKLVHGRRKVHIFDARRIYYLVKNPLDVTPHRLPVMPAEAGTA